MDAVRHEQTGTNQATGAGSHAETDISQTLDMIDAIALESVNTRPSSKDDRPLRDENSTAGKTDDIEALIGRQIGPYQLTTRIGSGALGNVYLATSDDDFARQVVVKVINRGIDGDVILRRFQSEIHIQTELARHPNIATFFDAGMTDEGWTYLVMEYVKGQPIDEYCDERRLDISERIRLVAQVCEATQFAHQHAVIHSDLKPSNILVTADGLPKIIDFGIANWAQPRTPEDQTVARVGTVSNTPDLWVTTPAYTSPEQVKGEAVTTATDIYALGVVLYRLLSGHWPYQLKANGTSEILQAICEQVPEKPSLAVVRRSAEQQGSVTDQLSPSTSEPMAQTWSEPALLAEAPSAQRSQEIALARGLSPSRLRRTLAGDLDSIVLMALRKEPERRYLSAERLGEDLRRYLDGFPVRARGDSLVYQAGKLVHRHALASAAGLILVLAFLAGGIGTIANLMTTKYQRDHALQSLLQTRQLVDQLFERVSTERLLKQPGLSPLRKQLLLDTQRYYKDLLDQPDTGHAIRGEQAMAHGRIAEIANLNGATTEAVAHYHQAVALWEKLSADQSSNQDDQANLAQTLNNLGVTLLALKGRLDEAQSTFFHAQTIVERLIAAHPKSVSQRLELGKSLQNIAEIQMRQGNSDEAVVTIERAKAIAVELTEDDPEAIEPRIALAAAYTTLGRHFGAQPEELLQAIAAYDRAIELQRALIREHPELAEESYRLALSLIAVSSLQQKIGQLDVAFESLRQALSGFEQINLLYPGVVSYQDGLGTTYNMMSDLERQRGESPEALTFGQKARVLFERLVAESPDNVDYRRQLTKSYNTLGRLQAQAGETETALRSFQRVIDLYESLHQLDSQDRYHLACNIALSIPLIGVKNGSRGAPQELGKGDQRRRQLYGDRAMESLRRAAQNGFLNSEVIQMDTDLDSLRARTDFQTLTKEIEEKPVTSSE